MHIAFHYVPSAPLHEPVMQILSSGGSEFTAEMSARLNEKYLDWPSRPFDGTWDSGTIYTVRASIELYDKVITTYEEDLAKIEFVVMSVGHFVECEERERWADIKKIEKRIPEGNLLKRTLEPATSQTPTKTKRRRKSPNA